MPKIVQDEDIYHVAMQLVIERGYAGATTKQIAEAADISEVTLFRKYGNKAQLVNQAIAATMKQMDIQSAAQYTGDIEADLLRVVQSYQNAAGKNGQFFYIMLTEMPRHPELGNLLDTPLTAIKNIGQLLVRYQTEGVLKPEHPLHAAAGLLGPLIATNIIRSSSTETPLPPIDLQNHVVCFLRGRAQNG